jgi:hypothetical protein
MCIRVVIAKPRSFKGVSDQFSKALRSCGSGLLSRRDMIVSTH